MRASEEHLQTAVDAIVKQWPNDVDTSPKYFFNELKMWRRNFLEQKNLHVVPTDFRSSLNMSNEIIFPHTHMALKLFCTLPVTTTPEHSFSTLRYLKTYLRSTMGADRLNGLALIYIHKYLEIKIVMLAQLVACLPLVQQVWGSIPGEVVNFNLKIFNLRARRGGDVHFLIARLYITGLD